MNKTAGVLRYNSISEQACPQPSLSFGQQSFLMPVTAEFAALFCTARKAEQYGVSALERLSGALESRKRAVESLSSAVERPTPCNGKLVFTQSVMCNFAVQQFVVVFCSTFSSPFTAIKEGNRPQSLFDSECSSAISLVLPLTVDTIHHLVRVTSNAQAQSFRFSAMASTIHKAAVIGIKCSSAIILLFLLGSINKVLRDRQASNAQAQSSLPTLFANRFSYPCWITSNAQAQSLLFPHS